MKTIKFTDPFVDNKEISQKDWESVGVKGQSKVKWNRENNFTAEVSDGAAEYLLEHEKNRFEIVEANTTSTDEDEEVSTARESAMEAEGGGTSTGPGGAAAKTSPAKSKTGRGSTS